MHLQMFTSVMRISVKFTYYISECQKFIFTVILFGKCQQVDQTENLQMKYSWYVWKMFSIALITQYVNKHIYLTWRLFHNALGHSYHGLLKNMFDIQLFHSNNSYSLFKNNSICMVPYFWYCSKRNCMFLLRWATCIME